MISSLHPRTQFLLSVRVQHIAPEFRPHRQGRRELRCIPCGWAGEIAVAGAVPGQSLFEGWRQCRLRPPPTPVDDSSVLPTPMCNPFPADSHNSFCMEVPSARTTMSGSQLGRTGSVGELEDAVGGDKRAKCSPTSLAAPSELEMAAVVK